ncbi:MAG: DUF72 domain-containing protein [bacterium]|nr:DUF72 domain-containing protein [bacterium]
MGRRRDQLELFTVPEPLRVGPAPASPALTALAARLPAGVRFGTSSWGFPGWEGIVWDRPATPAVLARHGLRAYAQHPLLRAVGLDRTYYAPIDADAFATMAAEVPDDFRLVVKAHELICMARVPSHERHGALRGQASPWFLDAAYTAREVVAPALAGLGAKLGVVVFQLPPQPAELLGGPVGFAARLRAFLRALPAGPCYAVELRTPQLLCDAYAAALADTGAVHCLNVHPAMPDVPVQAARVGTHGPLVVRWMLGRGFAYDAAVERYRPFDRLVDENPPVRRQVATLLRAAAAAGRAAYAVINNKAEGSAPLTIRALAAELAEPS